MSFTEQLAMKLMETPSYYVAEQEKPKVEEQAKEVAQFVASYTAKSVTELNRQIKTFNAVKDPEIREAIHKTVVAETIRQFPHMNLQPETLMSVVEKAIETCVQALTDCVIPIPQTVVQPFNKVKRGFVDFDLETRNMNWHPSSQSMVGTELREGGETFEYNPEIAAATRVDSAENEIIRHIIIHENVDYSTCADLLYKLVGEAKDYFCTYLSEEEVLEVMYQRQTTIADLIYAQMMQHFYTNEVKYRATEMRPFSRIETGFGAKIKSDEIYDLRATMPQAKFVQRCLTVLRKLVTHYINSIVIQNVDLLLYLKMILL